MMKVTVYFGNVRVIVPCGKGDVLVRDLMDMAITRYKKATGKPSSSSSIRIRNLKSSRDEGILYPEDRLSDVADDREQIIADYEENFTPITHYNCGDGTSTSSVCTGSPDLFSVEVSSHGSVQYAHSDVEITEESNPSGITPLQVRRGSEPALNSLCPSSPSSDPSKRWSTAVVINPASPEKQTDSEDSKEGSKEDPPVIMNGDAKPTRNFARGSGRLSIMGNRADTYQWVEAADRLMMNDLDDGFPAKSQTNCSSEPDAVSDSSSDGERREKTIILKNETGPLGIHVVPDYDNSGRDTGLVIQVIEAGGRIDRDGRFCVGDRIVEINNQSLCNVSFQAAQEIFKNALKTSQIKLEVVRGVTKTNSKTATAPRKPPPPVYPKPMAHQTEPKKEEDSSLVEGEERAGGVTTKVATVTPTKKMPSVSAHRLATANTRRIGKKIAIQLTKGAAGLGFSITTRDNPAGGNCPIYIKNILPKGAAIEDGRLKPGDRLLEVNSVEMTGKSQSDAVQILRTLPLSAVVNLVISRQEVETAPNSECETNSQASSSIKAEEEAGIFPWKHREILTFQIPLNDTGSAGLGISVKGKSTAANSGSVDLGIFIRSVISGGAASKDGRLQPNDQLVNINGISLLGISNVNAVETLRKAMTQMDGPIPNNIILTVARRTSQPSEDEVETSSVLSRSSNVNSQTSIMSNHSIKQNEQKHQPIEATKSLDIHEPPHVNLKTRGMVNGHALDSTPPGCNPVLERLTGQGMPFKKLPSDSYVFNVSNHSMPQHKIPSKTDHMSNMYSPTISVMPCESVLIEGEYNPAANTACLSDPSRSLSNIQKENPQNREFDPVSSQLSLEEIDAGFARDGFGRQSMSEKRHAQLDARNTDTYQRTKKVREEREKGQQTLEQEYYQHLSSQGKSESHLSTLPVPMTSGENEPRGPSLGLRKSSSLESLQTMIQELNKDYEALKKTLQSSSTRGSRNRGCNESFRAAVDRSYEAPPASAMETLDEESESGSSVGHILGRASELGERGEPGITRDPFPDDVLNMYCRGSKSSKKKSLLKGLGSVFKFGKSRKSMGDLKGKAGDYQDSETLPHLVHPLPTKDQDRISDQDQKILDVQKKPLPQVPRESSSSSMSEPIPNRQERMQNLREQHQRMHQKRQGHYPLDHQEELYESEIQAKERISGADIAHIRSHSHDGILNKPGSRSVYSESGRYSHYMNYKEIQQHMTQYYRQDQVPKQSYAAQNSGNYVPKNKISHPERPTSNFFEYESVHQLQQHAAKTVPDVDTSSLPRGSHIKARPLPFVHAQKSKQFYDFSGNYERRNVHHYYPNNNTNNNNNNLFPHVVPGSKV